MAAHTYVPQVRKLPTASRKLRVLAGGARAVLGLERLLGRVGAPFSADGLIVEATPTGATLDAAGSRGHRGSLRARDRGCLTSSVTHPHRGPRRTCGKLLVSTRPGALMTATTLHPSSIVTTDDENTGVTEATLLKLRRFNLIAGVLHLLSATVMLLLANDFELQVSTLTLNGPPGTPLDEGRRQRGLVVPAGAGDRRRSSTSRRCSTSSWRAAPDSGSIAARSPPAATGSGGSSTRCRPR